MEIFEPYLGRNVVGNVLLLKIMRNESDIQTQMIIDRFINIEESGEEIVTPCVRSTIIVL